MPLPHMATLRGGYDLRENKDPGTDLGPTVYQALFYILAYCRGPLGNAHE